MRFDRRVIIFATCSVVSFLLTWVADDKYDHVPPIVGTVYAFLAVAFLLDWWSRAREARDAEGVEPPRSS